MGAISLSLVFPVDPLGYRFTGHIQRRRHLDSLDAPQLHQFPDLHSFAPFHFGLVPNY